MKGVACGLIVIFMVLTVLGCDAKPAETTIVLDEKDREGVQRALEFKQQMDAQMQQQMQNPQQGNASPPAPAPQ